MGVAAGELYYSEEVEYFYAKQYLQEHVNKQFMDDLPSWIPSSKRIFESIWDEQIPAKRMESFGLGHNIIIRVNNSHEMWANVMAENKILKKQVENLNKLLDEKESILNKWLDKYVQNGVRAGQNLMDILFELYNDGLISISQVKERGGINQYEFVKILSQKKMSFCYPEEDQHVKEEKINKLLSLPVKE